MNKLQRIENTELSDYCIGILAKHDIFHVSEFVCENSERLMKILNLNADQVIKIKKALKRQYGPAQRNLNDFQDEYNSYKTHIVALDEMLSKCTSWTNPLVWEICGPSGVGKTQLAFGIITNFVQLHHSEALYLDTKLDFSARRIKNILTSRQLPTEVVAGCMQAIKVERVLSPSAVVEMLDMLSKELKKDSNHVRNIKLIVIDSLPSAWYLLKADSDRLAGRCLLSRLANLAYHISKEFQIWIIFINLSIIPILEQAKEEEFLGILKNEDEDEISKSLLDDEGDCETATYRQVMGMFWSSKPQIRLSVEYISESYNDKLSAHRNIKILQDYTQSEVSSCTVRICDQGVM